MQNNNTETFDPISKEDADRMKSLTEYSEAIIEVGQEFMLGETKYRIRKITNKDIVCRPVQWNQDEATPKQP